MDLIQQRWSAVNPDSNERYGMSDRGRGRRPGAALSLQQVPLEDGTQASTALETDPPSHPSARITGVFNIPATANGEVFRAEVGFCSGVTSGAQMRYAVFVGSSQQPAWSKTLDTSTSQLTSVEVDLPPGTTQITLDVANASPAAYGDVVRVDPRVEAANAPYRLPGRRSPSRAEYSGEAALARYGIVIAPDGWGAQSGGRPV